MKVYLIPGLGFDHRIFQKLELHDLKCEFLDWEEPDKKESLTTYAERFSKRINDNAEKTILIGHSLGGMLSLHLSTFKKIDKIILISSIRSRSELPLHFKIINPLNLHKLFTRKMVNNTFRYWGKRHDYESEEEQRLFKDMINKQSDYYLQWALKQLSIWNAPSLPSETKILQINGSSDKTFPLKLIDNANHILPNAGHFMVYKHAGLINNILMEELKENKSSFFVENQGK